MRLLRSTFLFRSPAWLIFDVSQNPMTESYWDHIKRAYDEVSVYDSPGVFAREFGKLAPYAADLLAAHWFLSEMSNGGIAQFFLNPAGVLAPEAARAFNNMEFEAVASALQKSIARFGPSYPRDSTTRDVVLCALAGVSNPSAALSTKVFSDEEDSIYRAAGLNLGRAYDRMDAYARAQKG